MCEGFATASKADFYDNKGKQEIYIKICILVLIVQLLFNGLNLPAGSFQNLNSEDIDNDVSDMWRTMYKLTKSLGDQPGPRNIADRVKGKIDKFKQHMPILHTICNPGIRDRHWQSVSTITTLRLIIILKTYDRWR